MQFAKNITLVLNYWFQQKSIPPNHATSKIIFIYKNPKDPLGNPLNDFRPISVTSPLFKLMELLIKKRIETLTLNNTLKIIHPTQHGFRTKLGTETNILRLLLDTKH